VGLKGAEHLEAVVVEENGAAPSNRLFYSAFGLTPKLGPMETGDWKSKKMP
jgi:thioredoxin reductase (NADPH)